eukprot:Skav209896  [mRNA]  locus=scaffold2642:401531:401746:- [translate_table: standard]
MVGALPAAPGAPGAPGALPGAAEALDEVPETGQLMLLRRAPRSKPSMQIRELSDLKMTSQWHLGIASGRGR